MKRGFIVVFLLFASCDKETRPAGILNKSEMVRVLTELYIAEDKVSRLGIKNDSGAMVFDAMKGKLFDKVGVKDSIFKRSMDYYMHRPKDMELIYTALIDSLNLKEQRASFPSDKK